MLGSKYRSGERGRGEDHCRERSRRLRSRIAVGVVPLGTLRGVAEDAEVYEEDKMSKQAYDEPIASFARAFERERRLGKALSIQSRR